MLICRNDAPKFYQKFKRVTEGHKPGASSCKDEKGNLVTNPQGVLRLWKKHFSILLQDDDDTNTVFRDVVSNPVEIPPPSHEEVRLKSNKAAGPNDLPVEL